MEAFRSKPQEVVKQSLAALDSLVLPRKSRTSQPNFLELTSQLSASNETEAFGVLALLHLFGVPDEDGKLVFPHGFPRNETLALEEIARGLLHGCALCHTLLGFLLSLSHPESLRRTRAWLRDDASSKSGTKGRLRDDYSLEAAIRIQSPTLSSRRHDVDVAALAYLLGAQLGDDIGAMAFAFAEAYGLRTPSWKLNSNKPGSLSLLSRLPKSMATADSDRCFAAAERIRRPALAAARNAESDPHRDWTQQPLGAQEPFQRSKAYADWLAARAPSDKAAEHALGRALFDGVDGRGRNISAAGKAWSAAAGSGKSPRSHWNLLMLQMRGDLPLGDGDVSHLKFVLENSSVFEPWQVAMALHYGHRFGLAGLQENATKSGQWLLKAAKYGDSNAQMLAAKALRGDYDPLLAGVDVGAKNETLAMHLLRAAAHGGRAAASFYVADTEIKQGNCIAGYESFATLSVRKHQQAFSLYAHARRAFHLGDWEGAGLRLLLLSEAGSWHAAREAAGLLGRMDNGWPCGSWRRCSLALRLRLGRGPLQQADQLAAAAAALRMDAKSDAERAKAGELAHMAAASGDPHGLWESARWDLCEPNGSIAAARLKLGKLWAVAQNRSRGHQANSAAGAAPQRAAAALGFAVAMLPETWRGGACSAMDGQRLDVLQDPDFHNRLCMTVLLGAVLLTVWLCLRRRRRH